MNVLEISVRSDIGGGPQHLFDLVDGLKQNNKIAIAAPESGEFTSKFKEISHDFLSIPYRKFSLGAFFKLLKYCKKNNIQIIHSHGRGAGVYSRLLKAFGFKVVHTFHGVHLEKTLIGKLKLIADKVLVPFTDIFICVSESERKNALKNKITNEQKTIVVHNGVKLRENIIQPKNDVLTIGTLSRLNYQKGLDILLKYFKRYEAETELNYKCLIAGDGELREDLHRQNSCNSVEFVGQVEPYRFLDSIDIYISFARWEGLPIAVIEAMSSKKVCILSNVEGNIDLISHNEDGFLFDLNNYEDFKGKLDILLSSNETRNKLSQNAILKVQNEFSVEKMTNRTLSIYKKIMK